jgi:predicted alpha-1,2-mannosidase
MRSELNRRSVLVSAVVCLVAGLAACGDEGGTPTDLADTGIDDVAADGSADAVGDADLDAAPPDGRLDTDDGSASTDADGSADAGPSPAPVYTGESALDMVNVFVGSGGFGFGYSGLTPAAQVPNGLVKLGPDTTNGGGHPDISHFSGYNYDDPHIRGFSHLRLIGTGAADLALFRFLPLLSRPEQPFGLWTPFSHFAEQASPGYYAARLEREDVDVQLTATQHVGVHEYTYGENGGFLVIDPTANLFDRPMNAARIEFTDAGFEGEFTWQGGFTGRKRGFTCYFVADVSGATLDSVWDGEAWVEADVAEGQRIAGLLRVDPFDVVTMEVGLSLISREQARANLTAQYPGSLGQTVEQARALWIEKMNHFEVRSRHEGNVGRFFTAVYNLYRMPSRLEEESGQYVGLDGEVHESDGFTYYSDLSLWDSFRTLHPLYEWIDPALEVDVLNSLLAMGEQYGAVPRWPAMLSETGSMLGSPSDQLFGGAAAKGLEGVDYQAAFSALEASLTGTPRTRGAQEDYLTYGYVPDDLHDESVSETLEYAWSDAGLASLAQALGLTDRAAELAERSRSYQDQLDPEEQAFMPRLADGTFERYNFTAITQRSGPITEGSIWHWRFYAIHDGPAYAESLGGRAVLGELLDEAFTRSRYGSTTGVIDHTIPEPYYWHGNQPSLGNLWMYAYSDRPWEIRRWVREIQGRAYTTAPDGLPGNDDGGTLSAWFVFSALGMYPIAGTNRYIVGHPLFEEVIVRPEGGGAPTTIRLTGTEPAAATWPAMERDGTPWNEAEITHQILLGSTLEFEGTEPAPDVNP